MNLDATVRKGGGGGSRHHIVVRLQGLLLSTHVVEILDRTPLHVACVSTLYAHIFFSGISFLHSIPRLHHCAMTDSKRTKRVRDVCEGATLDEHIAAKRRSLVAARENVPALKRTIQALEEKTTLLTVRYQVRQRRTCAERIAALKCEVDTLLSMSREHAFERTVVRYMRAYHASDCIGKKAFDSKDDAIKSLVKDRGLASQHRSVILDEYLSDMNEAPPKVAMATRDECPKCNVKLLLTSSRSIMSCPSCGYCVTYLDATSTSTSFDEVVEYSQYSYKRVNHYLMWLALVQGKEAHQVPDDILASVTEDLIGRQNVRQASDVTQKRVRESLRRLKLRKAYDHVAQITARISGIRAPRVSRSVEEQLKNMFLQMQSAFQRHAPKTRTNFLSYSYVLYRCFQILGLHHMLDGITLLKGRDKLEANDTIFRKMSKDLGWPVFDLPPVLDTV